MKTHLFSFIIVLLMLTIGCNSDSSNPTSSEKPLVICTTTMIEDLAKNLCAGRFEIIGLMKRGEDPHTYSPKPSDALFIRKAKIVLRNGIHLEGNLDKIIEKNLKPGSFNVALAESQKISIFDSSEYKGAGDPHCWFNVQYYKVYAEQCRDAFIQANPAFKDEFTKAATDYIQKLDALETSIHEKIQSIPQEQRILVTSHDAFQYFGKAYGLEVHAIIGISTEQQPRPQQIEELKELIVSKKVKAIFLETSVPASLNNILQKLGTKAEVAIGGTLYSDSLGDENSKAATYLDMMQHNVDIIVKGLKGKSYE